MKLVNTICKSWRGRAETSLRACRRQAWQSIVAFLFLAFPALATHVAVLETTAAKGVITLEEKQYLTDVLRSEAVKALPAEQNYTIMTRENISMMLPPGKAVEDCEGSCLVETGKNISADYIAQGHVGRFANNLTITVELYETAGNKLMGSFSTKAPDIESLEVEIRQKSFGLFSKITASSSGKINLQPSLTDGIGAESELKITIDGETQRNGRKYGRGEWEFSPGPHYVEFNHRCYETQKFKVNVMSSKTILVDNVMEPTKGNITIQTEYKNAPRTVNLYVNGAKLGTTPYTGTIPLCARVEVGEDDYREIVLVNWVDNKADMIHGMLKVKPTAEELRADSIKAAEEAKAREAEMAAQAAEAARLAAEADKKKMNISKPVSIALFALGLVSVGAGVYENKIMNDNRKKYNDVRSENPSDYDDAWKKADQAKTMRNILYGAGGGMMAVGTLVFFVF